MIEQIDNILTSMSDVEIEMIADSIMAIDFLNKNTIINKLELILTENCQFRCDYCFVHGKNDERKMDFSTARSAINLLMNTANDCKEIEITLFGGEPLIEYDLIKEIVSYTKKTISDDKRVIWALTTNGALIDEEKMKYFLESGINLLLSIDGNRETQDAHRKLKDGNSTFDLVFTKIPLMKKYQQWLGVRMTVNPDTADKILENVKYLREAGINQFIIGHNTDAIWNNDAFNEYKKQYFALADYYISEWYSDRGFRMTIFENGINELNKNSSGRWGCEAGRDKICVSTTGEIFPCSKFASLRNLSGCYSLGRVDKGIMPNINRFELQDMRCNIRGKCMECNNADYCTGGCPADNLLKTGSIFLPASMDCYFSRLYSDIHIKLPQLFLAHKNDR